MRRSCCFRGWGERALREVARPVVVCQAAPGGCRSCAGRGRGVAACLCCLTAAARRAVWHLGRALGAPDSGQQKGARRRALRVPASHSQEPQERAVAACACEGVWKQLLGTQRAVVEDVEVGAGWDAHGAVTAEGAERDRCRAAAGDARAMTGARDAGAGGRSISAPRSCYLRGVGAAGELPPTRGGGRARSRGPGTTRLHPCVRGSGSVAGRPHEQDRGRRADADRVADASAGSASG